MEYKKLSKKMSYALRHSPESLGLCLDDQGFAPVNELIKGLNSLGCFDKTVTLEDIIYMMSIMPKKRFEIVDEKIRAFYGHSFDTLIKHEEKIPPKVLYHGTAHKFKESIMEKGLIPNGRQYVHLSGNMDVAIAVGKRRDRTPLVFEIDTDSAAKKGIKFYVGNEDVWLADMIPPELLKEVGVIDE